MIEMSLAPSNTWSSNYKGATFGKTRTNGKFHSGLDLYAPEGTPVYAICDGVISDNKKFVTSQPNRDSKEWPVGYTGDKNAAGNRFSLESEVDGNVIYFVYWHMMAETPMSINPRTGKTFKPGDKVHNGLIAYILFEFTM